MLFRSIPSSYLKILIEKTGSVKPLSQIKEVTSQRSILADLGERNSEGVIGSYFAWNDNQFMGYYTFSIRNNLRDAIQDVVCLVIFYARDGLPLETEFATIHGPIGGNLAGRSPKLGRINADEVRTLTAKTEIRVLDFKLAE